MTLRTQLLLVLALACLTPSASWAGAWLQPPGQAYLRSSIGYLSTDQRYDQNGDRVPFDDAGGFRSTTYSDLLGVVYGELGLTPEWTFVGEVTWKRVEAAQEAANFVSTGPGDFAVGIRRKLWRDLWNVGSLSASFRFPSGYDTANYPSLGSGVSEVAVSFQVGASSLRYWGNIDAYVNLRGGDFRNQLGGVFSAGYNASQTVGFRGKLKGVAPVGDPAEPDPDEPFDPNTVDPAFVEFAVTGSWAVGAGLALEAELRGGLAARNTLAAPRISLAVATSPNLRVWGGP